MKITWPFTRKTVRPPCRRKARSAFPACYAAARTGTGPGLPAALRHSTAQAGSDPRLFPTSSFGPTCFSNVNATARMVTAPMPQPVIHRKAIAWSYVPMPD